MLRGSLACCLLGLLLTDANAQVSTVDFDNPAPPGASFDLLQGEFQGIDFGVGQWRWEGAFNVNPTNHIFFNSGTGQSRTFAFVDDPAVLVSITVFATQTTQLTLTDDTGQTLSVSVTPGAQQVVTTNWTNAATFVTVDSSTGWNLGVDDIVFNNAVPDTTLPTVTLVAPVDGATVSGDVLVAALANDDNAVAGVWFQIDGLNLGAEDTAFPFERVWDTITVPNGQYLLSARVRDEAGNQNASDTITVNVVNQGTGIDRGLRFFGNGANDIDRVKIPIDDPATATPGPPADVGAEDFTIDFWIRARAADNTAAALTCGANQNWINGNVLLARDRNSQGRSFGASIAGGVLAFGVDGDATGAFTLCGTTNVLDDQWHHVALQRRLADGRLWIYLDGQLEAEADGPDGDISYPDAATPSNNCGPTDDQPCTLSEPFLVVGAEPHDQNPGADAFNGWVDQTRMSNVLRFTGPFTPPAQPVITDGNTVALYDFNEATGDVINDSSGAAGGPSDGARNVGGTPAGPARVSDSPYGPQLQIVSPTDGETVTGTSIDVTYTLGGSLLEVDHVHFALDDGPERPDYDADGNYTVPNVAPGTHTISAFVVRSNHTHVTSFVDASVTFTNLPDPSDPVPPTVAITAPANLANVSGTISITADATDNIGIGIVEFYVGGSLLQVGDAVPPYELNWNTTTVQDGAYVLTAIARDIAGNSTTSAAVTVTVQNDAPSTDPADVGQWAAPIPLPIVAMNNILFHTGDVLMWDGFEEGANAWVFEWQTQQLTAVPNVSNQFCSGLVTLEDGRALVVGGHDGSAFVGTTTANIFDPLTRTWIPQTPMANRRWYPTATTLADGRVLAVSGTSVCQNRFACVSRTPEVFDPATNTWTELTDASLLMPLYPFMFQLPDGRVAYAGSDEADTETLVLDVDTSTWTTIDPNPVTGGSAAMYRPGVVIKSGTPADVDLPPSPTVNDAYVIDFNQPSPTWRQVGSMAFPRGYHTLTMLPDGNVIVTGGLQTTDEGDDSQAVYAAEIWDTQTETWSTMAGMERSRSYHSTGLLLPDGRVLVTGSGRAGSPNVPNEFSAEIFSPPYLFRGARPTIAAAPPAISIGESFIVNTPDAADVAQVTLLRPGAVTHAFDQNQRFIPLNFQVVGNDLQIDAPANFNQAPPGYYMLFLINTAGVPSMAEFVQLPLQALPPAPTINTLTPNSAPAGDPGFTLRLDGTNFAAGSIVRWNGADRTTTFVSGTQLDATIPAADIATAGTAAVTVFNPAPGGGVSNTLTFTITAAGNPLPATSGLAPATATAGDAGFPLTVNGTNFIAGSVVRWNGTDRATTFVSANELTATITTADVATAGTAAVTVFNPAPGGGTSNPQTFTINAPGNPLPATTGIAPQLATAGDPGLNLTVTGTDFLANSVVRWNGADRATTFVSGTELTAAITAADLATAGAASVTVFNPAPGGGTSNPQVLTIEAGGGGTEVTVTFDDPVPPGAPFSLLNGIFEGIDFGANAWRWDTAFGPNPTNHIFFHSGAGTSRTFQFNPAPATLQSLRVFSGTTGTLTLSDDQGQNISQAVTPGSLQTVTTGWTVPSTTVIVNFTASWALGLDDIVYVADGGGQTNPVPAVTGIAPTAATAGDPGFTLTVNGADFVAASIVRWNGANRATTFVSANQLQATITAADIATEGTAAVTVFNPAPGGGTSGPATFTIDPAAPDPNPVPGVTGIAPTSATAGDPGFTLTVNGADFVAASIVRWNGANRATTFVSANQLQATITATDIATEGTATVTVFNPAPGGGTSGTATFTIDPAAPDPNPEPVLTNVTPRSTQVNSGPVQLTLTGTDFSTDSVVRLNGADIPTTFVSANELLATIAAGSLGQPGIVAITVFSPTPGGGSSQAESFFVLQPGDSLFYDNFNRPDDPAIGNAWTEKLPNAFALSGNQITSIDTGTTGYVDSIVYRPLAEDALEIEAGIEFVRLPRLPDGNFPQIHTRIQRDSVTQPATLNSYIFFINDYAPLPAELVFAAQGVVEGECYIDTLPLPVALEVGERYRFRVRVTGTNPVSFTGFLDQFDGQSWQVVASGSATHDASTQPTPGLFCESTPTRPAAMPAPIVNAGSVGFAKWWDRGDNYDNFYVISLGQQVNPAPVVTTIAPAAIAAGSSGFDLTLTGTGFVNSSIVRWNGADRPTTFVSPTELRAAITAADVATAGTAAVTVFTPAPGGGTSAPQNFTITANNPIPAITQLQPDTVTEGGVALTLNVNGQNLTSQSVVRWNGANRPTTFINANQLSADISAADIATTGTAAITVFTPAPGGGTSNSLTLTIDPATPGNPVTVDFDTPTPPGSSFDLLNGVFEGIDFGVGQWRWETAFGPNPTNHIFFDSGAGSARSFTFAGQPRTLQSIEVFTTSSGTLTLTDDAGQNFVQAITAGGLITINTGWTLPATSVTIQYTNGWALGVDDITYE